MQRILLLSFALIAHGFQSAQFTLSPSGTAFQAANTIEQLSTSFSIRNVISCATLCLRDVQCSTFEFDSQSQSCRLFEGSVESGSLLPTIPTTVVGWINVDLSIFRWYNTSSDQCVDNRFLSRDNLSGLCRCPTDTFWNGSMCVNQRYSGEACLNDQWCCTGLSLSCIGFFCSNSTAHFPTTGIFTAQSPTTALQNSLLETSSVAATTISSSITTDNTSTPTLSNITITNTAPRTTALVARLTAPPPCPPQASLTGILYSSTNPTTSMTSYTCFAFTWAATGLSATLTFAFRNDPSAWLLDDVSVYSGLTQIITNGGFENSLTGWSRAGSSAYKDPCSLYTDTLSQNFSTVLGDTYVISFWLANQACCGTTVIADIIVS